MEQQRISPASLSDIPELVQLVNSAYRGESSRIGWTTEADLLDGIRTDEHQLHEVMQRPHAVILKYCEDNGAINGCVFLEKLEQQMYLGMLTVNPQIQARGLGKELLAAGEAYARFKGSNAVVMSVISDRHELIQWYERRGYRLTGERKPFPMDDPNFGLPKKSLEFVILKKQLS